jgi:hypothetical protein
MDVGTNKEQGNTRIRLETVPTLLSIHLELQIMGRGEVEVDSSEKGLVELAKTRPTYI